MQTKSDNYSEKPLLSKNIKFLRTKAGLNQEELAEKVGLNRDNITSYERGFAPKLDALLRIVKFFHVSVEELCELDLEINGIFSSELNSDRAVKRGSNRGTITKNEELLLLSEHQAQYQRMGSMIQMQEVENLKKEVQQLRGIIQMQETTIKAYESAIKAQETTIETLKNAKFPTQVPVLAPTAS